MPGNTRQALMYQARLMRFWENPTSNCFSNRLQKNGDPGTETVQLLSHGLDCYRLPTAPPCPPPATRSFTVWLDQCRVLWFGGWG